MSTCKSSKVMYDKGLVVNIVFCDGIGHNVHNFLYINKQIFSALCSFLDFAFNFLCILNVCVLV